MKITGKIKIQIKIEGIAILKKLTSSHKIFASAERYLEI